MSSARPAIASVLLDAYGLWFLTIVSIAKRCQLGNRLWWHIKPQHFSSNRKCAPISISVEVVGAAASIVTQQLDRLSLKVFYIALIVMSPKEAH